MEHNLHDIASQFELKQTVESIQILGEGFINDTFVIKTLGDKTPNFILQKKNNYVFKDIPAMMHNIEKVSNHIKLKASILGGDPLRQTLTIIPTKEGNLYYNDNQGNYWVVYLFIEDTTSFVVATTPELAFKGGQGIGLFQSMMADFHEPLTDILPGFHNIRFRFNQWDNVLKKDPVSRKVHVHHEISWIEARRKEMMGFWELVESGKIPKRVTHNDTKISNILFDNRGNFPCVIDLDTVLYSTALNDFGDAIRSYTNTGAEDDKNLDNVEIAMTFFEAYTRGYLSQAMSFLSEIELEYLAFSARYITFEQVLRFFMDYIDGDNYYKIKSPGHNLQRTHAQYKLLTSMEANYPAMCNIVQKIVHELNEK